MHVRTPRCIDPNLASIIAISFSQQQRKLYLDWQLEFDSHNRVLERIGLLVRGIWMFQDEHQKISHLYLIKQKEELKNA